MPHCDSSTPKRATHPVGSSGCPAPDVGPNHPPATKLILLKELGRTPQPAEFAIPRGESDS